MCLPIWQSEARTLGRGHHQGFEWQITYNIHAARCGYVKLTPAHPWFGIPADEIPAEAHGGLNFSEYGTACPTHGEKAEWWIGFDCDHLFDARDPELLKLCGKTGLPAEVEAALRGIDAIMDQSPMIFRRTVRTQEYVQEQVFALVEQAREAQIGAPA